MDNLYTHLLETYRNKPYADYIEERNKVIKDVKTLPSSSFTYKDFVPYPEHENKSFNELLISKKEFARNKTNVDLLTGPTGFDKISSEKCSLTDFSLTSNQRFIKSFMSPLTPYNGLLLFHSVGVGKTCTAISIAEQYHDIYQKKVLVILSSNLIENFKKQIFDVTKYDLKTNSANLCTGTKYADMIMDKRNVSPDELQKRVNKIINEKYQFIGYKELAIYMEKIKKSIEEAEVDPDRIEMKFNQRLSEVFSDRLIIIDEAHNLRNPSETGKKMISNAFKTLLKHAVNVKLVLLTATPMFNNAKEITWTLNLLLMNDKRDGIETHKVFDKTGKLTKGGRQILIDASRGYVSALRGENPFTFPFRLYPSINKDNRLLTPQTYPKNDMYGEEIVEENRIKHMEIVTSAMSDYQKKVYDLFKKKISARDLETDSVGDVNGNDDEADDVISNDLQNTLQVANVVYPIGDGLAPDSNNVKNAYGKGGLEACLENDKGKYSYRHNKNQFLAYSEIGTYAPKIKTILDCIIKSRGIVFVYSQYYSSGIIPLAIALEHIGFVKYGSKNISRNIKVDDKFQGTKPQYIIVSRMQEISPANDIEIAASKSSLNKDGDQIKVIIVSKIGTEGIDFKRIREVHLLEPWFNLNRAEQIIGRAVRYCSHIDLPRKHRNVTIFFHANTYSQKEESIDLRTYRMAENKQKNISIVERVLKETSIDCNLNKDTLVFPVDKLNISFDIETSQGKLIKDYKVGDRDNSYVCGLKKCEAVCTPNIDTKTHDIDTTTFDGMFITDEIDIYKRYIGNLFSKGKHINLPYKSIFSKLKTEYGSIEEGILIYALETMVNSKHVISDNRGKIGYLIYRGDQYIFHEAKLTDHRMTLEERGQNEKIRRFLDLKDFLQNLEKEKPPQTTTHQSNVQKEDDTNEDIIDVIENEINEKLDLMSKIIILYQTASSSSDIVVELKLIAINKGDDVMIKHLDSTFPSSSKSSAKKSKLGAITEVSEFSKNLYKVISTLIQKTKNSVVDSVVDSLNKDQFIGVLNDIVSKPSRSVITTLLLKSFSEGGIIDQTAKYAYNHFDEEIYCFKKGRFVQCNADDNLGNKAFAKFVKVKTEGGLQLSTKSYIAIKDATCHFKIRESDKTKGYVCHITSSLTIDGLKGRIDALLTERASVKVSTNPQKDVNVTSKKTLTKQHLCWFYEVLSRTFTPEHFQRPHFIKIEKRKGKDT